VSAVRVLLVEDERTLARAVKRGLDAEGLLTDVVHDGMTGSERAVTGEYDVVVLDIMLPGRNGYDVCRDMRDHGVWTPVMMLTAKSGEYDEVDAFDLGADDYLTKPFSFPVLVARLRALVRRGGIERPAVLRAGTLELDPATRQVSREGSPIELTSRHGGEQAGGRAGGLGRASRRQRQPRRGLHRLPPAQGRPTLRRPQHPDRARVRVSAVR
jgi:two-component system OmpR family response regulator